MAAPAGIHVVEDPPADARTSSAPIVVVVHGAMDRAASFGRVAKQLHGRHVVRYDRRGYGRSAASPIGGLHDHVDDLMAIVDERPAVVFGHSIGAVVALIAAVESPESIRSVLAYEPPTPWQPWWPEGSPAPEDAADEAEAFMRRAIGDRFWSRLPARTRADRRAEGPALRADIASLQGPAPFDPRSIAVPVIVGSGSDAARWHARAAEEVAGAIPGAAHEVVAGAGHGVHLTHPRATAQLIEQAIARADHRSEPSR